MFFILFYFIFIFSFSSALTPNACIPLKPKLLTSGSWNSVFRKCRLPMDSGFLDIWLSATLIEGSLLSIRLFEFWKSDKRLRSYSRLKISTLSNWTCLEYMYFTFPKDRYALEEVSYTARIVILLCICSSTAPHTASVVNCPISYFKRFISYSEK